MKLKIPMRAKLMSYGLISFGLCLAVSAADPQSSSPSTYPANATKGEGASRLTGTDSQGGSHATHDVAGINDPNAFVKKALEGNAAEVALGEVAQRKAQNADVKEFGSMLQKDHSQANQQLQQIAQNKGISADTTLDARHQKKVEHFQSLSGSEFDKAFITDMLKDHAKDISMYEKASQFSDPEISQYAQTTLPKLRQHLDHAVKTASAVGIDQATVSSILKESPGAMGGSQENWEKSSGSSQKSKY